MAKNSAKFVKRAAIAALKAAAPLGGVPADRVYPMQRPAKLVWPWIGYGAVITAPFGASCLDGSDITVAIHGFAQTTGEGGATVSGEDAAHDINAAVEASLDGATVDLTEHGCPYPATAHFTSTGGQVIQDGQEAGKYHGFVSFRIVVSS
jgi:hypothetical protein